MTTDEETSAIAVAVEVATTWAERLDLGALLAKARSNAESG